MFSHCQMGQVNEIWHCGYFTVSSDTPAFSVMQDSVVALYVCTGILYPFLLVKDSCGISTSRYYGVTCAFG